MPVHYIVTVKHTPAHTHTSTHCVCVGGQLVEGVSHFTLHCLSSKVASDHVTFEQEQLIRYLPSMDLQWV